MSEGMMTPPAAPRDALTSPQLNELAAALAKAQGEMETAIKSAENPFFKSSYADLPAYRHVAREPLAKHGLSVTQSIDESNGKLRIVTMLLHASGQWVRSFLPVNPVKNDPQGVGSAITYMRRYSYAAIIGAVAEDEDDDGESAMGRGRDKKSSGNSAKPGGPSPMRPGPPEKSSTVPKPSTNAGGEDQKPSSPAKPPAYTDEKARKMGFDSAATHENAVKMFWARARNAKWSEEQVKELLQKEFGVPSSKELSWSVLNNAMKHFQP